MEHRVSSDQRQVLDRGLGDQESIEWVAVVRGKGGHPVGVNEGHGQLEKSRLTRRLLNGAGRAQASEADLDRDLPAVAALT